MHQTRSLIYYSLVRPFASPEEYQITAGIVGRFGEGIGKDLHQKLLLRAKMKRNWVLIHEVLHALLKNIYPKSDSFIQNIEYILRNQTSVDLCNQEQQNCTNTNCCVCTFFLL